MTDTDRPSFLDRQRDAALAELREKQDEFRRVADIVLGTNRGSRQHVTNVIKLGDDYLVEVTKRDETLWTTVVRQKASNSYFYGQEEAILHLIARRYDDNPNSNGSAAFYAGRVLGIPTAND